ncbi:hypothetical protein IAT40_006369 [Kwoniella sp. CBS 6097]
MCSPSHYCLTLPILSPQRMNYFETVRVAYKDNHVAPNCSSYNDKAIATAFEGLFDKFRRTVDDVRPSGLQSLTLHNYRTGPLDTYEVRQLRVFCARCECRTSSKNLICFQHADHQVHLAAFNMLAASAAKIRKGIISGEYSSLRMVDNWELISPPEVVDVEGEMETWFDLKEQVVKSHPGWEKENCVMVEYKYAAPCVCCGTKDGK